MSFKISNLKLQAMWSGNDIANRFKQLQAFIVAQLEIIDGVSFSSDEWERSQGGGGITKTIVNGNVIEKGGVAFSKVEGEVTPLMKSQMGMQGNVFLATGVSIVLHSKHPLHPIIHMNVRYFETDNNESWFGGGIDLTPIYIEPKKARRFHEGLSEICGNYQSDAYDKFKAWADDYFFLSHRNETRGVGGIFFDHVKPENEGHKDALMNFCLALGEAFPKLYAQQLVENPALPTTNELEWQAIRRSRYVEFNLLFDKGTKFGIVSNGRTESIFLSMPPVAKWVYNFQPETDTREHHTLQLLTKGIDWLNYSA